MTQIYTNPPLRSIEQRLDGSVYVAVVGAPMEYSGASSSIRAMQLRPGDGGDPTVEDFLSTGDWTKGAEAREYHIRRFLQTDHAFLLFVDGDMYVPSDLLERLRSHGLPCVSGLYFRRTHKPSVIPIWFEDDPEFRWPMMPFRYTPERGRLYRLGATGFGCWLIHRSVFQALDPILKGEAYVWQDDMDVWPYSLKALLDGSETLRVLRGRKDQVGADIRLGYFIRRAGFTLWGDPAAACGHDLHYPLGLGDWQGYDDDYRAAWAGGTEYEIELVRAQFAQEGITA